MSSEVLILPSFNRYFPQVVSQSPSGIIAYGCRNIIYLFDARCYPPVILDSKCIHKAYKEKVAALSFCKCKNSELLASISDCGEVKIWDIETATCLNNYVVKEGVSNIEWIHGSPNTVVFPQDSKVLIKWNVSTNNTSRIKLGSELKTCFITSNEKCPNLIAVGHNNGTITVLDIVQEKILHKFRDHTREINILAWNPVSPDILLSVGLDYSARLWRMGEEKSIKLHWIGRARPDDRKRIRVLGICHPKDADVMICSNTYGEIGEVSLAEEKPRFKPYSKMYVEINCRCLFALFSGILETEQGTVDILYCFDNYVFSIWNISEKKLISYLPFFMGFIYDLSFSPVNPIYLSISNGDGILRVWNSQADSQTSRMISVFVQAKTKIMTAAWHPIWENIIAFGTDDGKLGIIDTIKKRSQYPFETFHKGRVYCVCWGPYKASPIEDARDDEYFIYSCGGGDIHINRYKKLNEQALNFHEIVSQPADIEPIEGTCSEIIWKSDYSCVCIGTYKGFIDVYSDELVFLTRCNIEMKCIESLKWHPESTYMSPNGSPLKFWLACSGNDPNIYIVDTSKIFEEKTEDSTDWIVKKLSGHKKHINATCWSPHMDGYLVSASKDGSALVWNVCTGNIIVSFLNHYDIVNTVQWSVFDEDVIYSGGQDNCVRVWRISQQKSIAPADKAPTRKKLKRPKAVLKGGERLQDSEDEVLPENENATLNNENTIVENSETVIDKDESTETVESENADENMPVAQEKKKFGEKYRYEGKQDQALWLSQSAKKSFSLFGLSRKSVTKEDLKDCMELADILYENSQGNDESFDPLKPTKGVLSDEDVLRFGLYTDQTTALRMADIQADVFKSKKDTSQFCQLSIMTNKVQMLIQEAAEKGTLSSYLVSLAPSVSYSFWLEMCEKYALQLLQEQQPYVACTYFLMCNKTYEAVDVLKEKGKIIDAFALAKLRLPESDPVILQLLHLIRKRYRDVSNSLGEVKCYLTLNDTMLAVKTLGSMPDVGCIKVAAYICKKYHMDEEAEKYMFIFVQRCLMQCDWESFREFANEEPSLQVYSILFAVHEAFYVHLRKLKNQSGIFLKEMFSLPNSEELVKFWNGSTCIDSDKSFLEYVCDDLESKKLFPTDASSLDTIIQSLNTFSSKWNVLESSSDAHVAIAVYMTKYILLTSVGDSAAATANFLKIFETSCNIVFLPKVVFMLFFPMNLLWSHSMKSFICKSKAHNLESSTNMVVSHYQNITRCFSEKIMTKLHPFGLNIVSKDTLQNNLRCVTEQIATALSIKEFDEFILAYFVSYIVHDLSRLNDKKVLVAECHVKKLNFHLENKAEENILPNETVGEVPAENNLINENGRTEIQKEESSELKALIKDALEEAEEKIRTLTNFQATDASSNSFEAKDIPDSCSIDLSENDGKICEEVNLKIGNECENVSNGECYIEVSSSETESNVGNCVVQVSSNDKNSHAQCLASIDLFYHLILYIVSSVCKEEFALLHYLKEHLKCLQLARASLELSKFSKENKGHVNKSKLCLETESLGKAKELKNKADLLTVVQSDKSLNEASSTAGAANQIEAYKDGGDKSEHCISDVESVNHDPNINENREQQCELPDCTSESANNDPNTDKNNESQCELSHFTIESFNNDPNADVNNERPSVLSNFIFKSVNNIPNTDQNDGDKSEICNSATESANQVHSNDIELRTIISNDHNYSSPLNNLDFSQEMLQSSNEIDDNSNPIISQREDLFKEISELINLLDLKSKGISYPSPLEIIPKVLQVLYDVRKNSTCSIIQEKLHMLIDDILQWAGTFQISKYNFACEICQ